MIVYFLSDLESGLGELEKTMLVTFCAASRVKAILQHPDAPAIIKSADVILKQCHSNFDSEIPVMDILNTEPQKDDTTQCMVHGSGKSVALSADLRTVLAEANIKVQDDTKVEMYSRFTIGKLQYATRAVTSADCQIFWNLPTGQLVPGVIEHIFSIPLVKTETKYFIAARRNLPIPTNITDPFLAYPDFGAGLWSERYASVLNVLPVVGSTYCHAISMPWEDGVLVLKPLNKVSFPDK